MAVNSLFESMIGTLCEIKAENNDTLAVVRVISYDTGDTPRLNFEAADSDDRLPTLTFDSSVKVVSYAGDNNFILMRGTVYISNDKYLVLVDVHASQDYERRKYFRLNTNVPAELESESGEEDPFPATVLDVSLGGIRISCTNQLQDNAVLFATFKLLDHKMEIFCRVCREIPTKPNPQGLKQYGCEFVDYTARQIDLLCNDIFKLQRLELQRRKKR